MSVRNSQFFQLIAIVCAVFVLGCTGTETTKKDDSHNHDGHSHAESMSLGDTVKKAESLITQITEGFEANDMDKAHGPLHDIGHVLEGLPKLVDASEMSDEDKKAVKDAVESLMDSFGQVDAKLHGQEGVDFADVKDKVAEAIKVVVDKTK